MEGIYTDSNGDHTASDVQGEALPDDVIECDEEISIRPPHPGRDHRMRISSSNKLTEMPEGLNMCPGKDNCVKMSSPPMETGLTGEIAVEQTDRNNENKCVNSLNVTW